MYARAITRIWYYIWKRNDFSPYFSWDVFYFAFSFVCSFSSLLFFLYLFRLEYMESEGGWSKKLYSKTKRGLVSKYLVQNIWLFRVETISIISFYSLRFFFFFLYVCEDAVESSV